MGAANYIAFNFFSLQIEFYLPLLTMLHSPGYQNRVQTLFTTQNCESNETDKLWCVWANRIHVVAVGRCCRVMGGGGGCSNTLQRHYANILSTIPCPAPTNA